MDKVLFVNSCVRNSSRTLDLAKTLLERLKCDCEEINVTDGKIKPLDSAALEKRTEKIIKGDFSDGIFEQAKKFARADVIVIAAPFWDLSFPSFLKIYLENVLVAGVTFTYKNGVPEGLCKAKKLYYVTTSGGMITVDFGFSYVKALAENFFGIPLVTCCYAEGLDVKENDVQSIMNKAKESILSKD